MMPITLEALPCSYHHQPFLSPSTTTNDEGPVINAHAANPCTHCDDANNGANSTLLLPPPHRRPSLPRSTTITDVGNSDDGLNAMDDTDADLASLNIKDNNDDADTADHAPPRRLIQANPSLLPP
jgi:hypothetical protein